MSGLREMVLMMVDCSLNVFAVSRKGVRLLSASVVLRRGDRLLDVSVVSGRQVSFPIDFW